MFYVLLSSFSCSKFPQTTANFKLIVGFITLLFNINQVTHHLSWGGKWIRSPQLPLLLPFFIELFCPTQPNRIPADPNLALNNWWVPYLMHEPTFSWITTKVPAWRISIHDLKLMTAANENKCNPIQSPLSWYDVYVMMCNLVSKFDETIPGLLSLLVQPRIWLHQQWRVHLGYQIDWNVSLRTWLEISLQSPFIVLLNCHHGLLDSFSQGHLVITQHLYRSSLPNVWDL